MFKKYRVTKFLFVLFTFALLFGLFVSQESSYNTVYADHICGDCPAGYRCGPTGTGCCENHGCQCVCGNQCTTNSGWTSQCPGSYCCGGNPPPPPDPKMDIGGYVVNKDTGIGISGVQVQICGSNGSCTTQTTDANGFYRNNSFLNQSLTSYAVRINNVNANPPSGYVGQATAGHLPNGVLSGTSILQTFRPTAFCGNRETLVTDTTYECQQYGINDCATANTAGTKYRCNFKYQPLTPPTGLQVVNNSCETVATGPRNTATFRWNVVPGASRYILRVNRLDNANPEWVSANDWWQYVPGTTGSCTATTCTATLPGSVAKVFMSGQYLGWGVQAEAPDGTLSAQTTAPGFVAPSCFPYTISGIVQEVSVNTSTNTCTVIGELDNVADVQGENLRARYSATSFTYNREDAVGVPTANSSYTITDIPGSPGRITMTDTSILARDAALAEAGVGYTYACIKPGNSAAYQYQPTPTGIQLNNPFNSNLVGYNFGYRLDNPYAFGWFASLNADTYGNVIDANVPPNPQGNVEPFLAFNDNNRGVAVFGNNVSVSTNPNRLVEGGKYITNFTGDFWPSTFSFDAPADAVQISNVSQLQNTSIFQTGRSYKVSVDIMNNYLSSTTSYTLGGGPGVAVVYVDMSGGALLTFTQNFRSNDVSGNRRILFVSKPGVSISPGIGYTVPSGVPANLRNQRPHIEAAMISQSSINFGSVYNAETGNPIDRLILLEGPFVAGTDENSIVNITLSRNLGIYNAIYPAAMVKYNHMYMNHLTESSGVMQSDIVWQVKP